MIHNNLLMYGYFFKPDKLKENDTYKVSLMIFTEVTCIFLHTYSLHIVIHFINIFKILKKKFYPLFSLQLFFFVCFVCLVPMHEMENLKHWTPPTRNCFFYQNELMSLCTKCFFFFNTDAIRELLLIILLCQETSFSKPDPEKFQKLKRIFPNTPDWAIKNALTK